MRYYKYFVKQYNTYIVICIGKIVDEYGKFFKCLSSSEKREYEEIKTENRRREYVLGHYAEKNAVSILLNSTKDLREIEIKHGVLGQPIVAGCGNIQVSLSHNKEYVVAVAFEERYTCGIDIENIDESNREVILHHLTKDEKTLFKKSSLLEYTVLWTAKEAISKVLKTGLTTELFIYEINSLQRDEKYYRGEYKHFGQYSFVSTKIDDNVLTLAYPQKSEIFLTEEKPIT